MKKFLLFLVTMAAGLSGCTESGIKDKDDNVEEMCKSINADISSIHFIVDAIQNNGYVMDITPLVKESEEIGYTLIFDGYNKVVIKMNDSGEPSFPSIGVMMEGEDGPYYWTVGGEWLVDDSGDKIEVDDMDLQLKVEEGYWFAALEGSKELIQLGKVEIVDNVSLFKDVTYDEKNVHIVLHDGSELAVTRICPLNFSIDAELPLVMEPNSTLEVGYVIESSADEVTIDVEFSEDMTAEVVPDDMYSGVISIRSGNIIDKSSHVTAVVSDGRNVIRKKMDFVPAEGPIFEFSPDMLEISSAGGEFEITVVTNIGYYISGMSEWIKEVGSSKNDDGRTIVHVFKAEPNPSEEPRSGMVSLCSDEMLCYAVPVNQKGAVNLEGKSFHHRSIAMRFTADWCGYCPNMATAFDKAKEEMAGKLEVISIHGDGGLKFNKAEDLKGQYMIGGYPMGIIDGRMLVENYGVESIIKLVKKYSEETENTYSTVSGISFTSSCKDNNLVVNVEAYLKNPETYKITVMVVEDNYVGYQANNYTGTSNDYIHNGVARLALTNACGDSFSTESENEMKTFTYESYLPSKYEISNMRIVICIQRQFGTQEKIQTAYYGDYYIDNCVSGKIGETVDLKFAE